MKSNFGLSWNIGVSSFSLSIPNECNLWQVSVLGKLSVFRQAQAFTNVRVKDHET